MFSFRAVNAFVNITKAKSLGTFQLMSQRTVKSKVSGSQAQVKQLKAKLQKEKKRLAEYKTKHNEKTKSLKLKSKSRKAKETESSKKAAEAEKKLIKKATKAYRNLSALNFFVKDKCTASNTLKDVNAQWAKLSESEKAVYVARADKHNEEKRKIWTEGPKKPPTSYSLFVKKNWKNLGDFKASSKAISDAWKALSDAEKDAYKPEASAFTKFKKAHDAWVANRVKLYKEKINRS